MLLEVEGSLDVTFSVVGAVVRNDLAGVLNILPLIPVILKLQLSTPQW